MQKRKILCGALVLSCCLLTACGQKEPELTEVNTGPIVTNYNMYITLNNSDPGGHEIMTSKDGTITYCDNLIDGITILSDKTNHSNEYVVPMEVDGKTVTKIGNSVYKNKGFTKVIIPDCIKIIDDMAFMDCVNLMEVVVGTDLIEIRECAFQNCYNLSSITLNEGLFRLGKSAFSACYNLKSINLPNTIENIDSYCFTNCGLTSVTIPEKLVVISPGVFMGCSDMQSVKFSGPVYLIDDKAFAECTTLVIDVPEMCEKVCLTSFENVRKVTVDEGIYCFPEELKYDGDFSEYENAEALRYYYNYTEKETTEE